MIRLLTHKFCGLLSMADVAGTPSPEYPLVPLPAIVVITLVVLSMRRTRRLLVSEIKRLPLVSP
jgi:hypothetical protein